MCVTFLAVNCLDLTKGRYKLILLNNRDEYYDRPTSKLHWEGDILAGRDEKASERGTWLGVNRRGRIGNILSITEPKITPDTASRGSIVNEFLTTSCSGQIFLTKLATRAKNFNGFQLLAIDRFNIMGEPEDLLGKDDDYSLVSLTNKLVEEVYPNFWPAGVYGFGNSPRSHPFRKVVHGERIFSELITNFDFESSGEEALIEGLLNIATDRTVFYPDEQILGQLKEIDSPDVENFDYSFRTSIFVESSNYRYGTRSHSILLVDKCNDVTFFERRMAEVVEDVRNARWENTVEKFKMENNIPSR